ncbi:hypothetical protein V8F20_001901 [Naviculisporaceae sp. PSN 640]
MKSQRRLGVFLQDITAFTLYGFVPSILLLFTIVCAVLYSVETPQPRRQESKISNFALTQLLTGVTSTESAWMEVSARRSTSLIAGSNSNKQA